MSFDAGAYGGRLADLLQPARLNALGPGTPHQEAKAKLRSLDVGSAFAGFEVVDHDAARCCLAGVWLLHDFLEESHTISQGVETTTGSYWHGIMHRREPDYSNAKYWFRRVGEHAVFAEVQRQAEKLAADAATLESKAEFLVKQPRWDPVRFIDLCEAAAVGQSEPGGRETAALCREIAQAEWRVLFDDCFGKATGASAKRRGE